MGTEPLGGINESIVSIKTLHTTSPDRDTLKDSNKKEQVSEGVSDKAI